MFSSCFKIQNKNDYYFDWTVPLYFILSFRNAYSATRNHPFRSRFLRTREYESSENEDNDTQNKNEQRSRHENKASSDVEKQEKPLA